MTAPRPNGRWFRDIYRDAVWESEELTAQEKAVAETYARHARDEHDNKSATADLAWTTYPRLMAKAGIGRRANVSTAVASLVKKGWLTVVREASRRPTLYRLTIPVGGSDGGTTSQANRSSGDGTTVVPRPAAGSSTSAAGSSDGGTQPLGPLESRPPTSLSDARTSVPAPSGPNDDRERDEESSTEDPNPVGPLQRFVIKRGAPQHLATQVVEFIEATNAIDGFGWWITASGNGTLAAQVATAVEVLATSIGGGDQTLSERNGVPAGQRPVVYDVALEIRGPKPSKEGENKGGKGKGEATPGTGTTPGTDTGGGTDTPSTPGMDTSPTPGMDTPQISPSKNPLNNPSSPAVERGTSPRSNMQEEGKTDDPKTRADLAIMATAVRLAAPYQGDMTVIESRRLASHVVTALAKGWPEQAVADALARDLAGLDSVAAGLIGRMMELAATPVQPDPHRVREAVG